MTISRGYLVVGALYLCAGVLLGMYMGGTQDFSMAPAHAHINLLGFMLMTVFGLVYRQIPAMDRRPLAWLQFGLHQFGALGFLGGLTAYLGGFVPADAVEPVLFPITTMALFVSVVLFLVNLIRNGSEAREPRRSPLLA